MKLIRVVTAVAAVALLGACSPMPGTAAVVNGTTISEADIDRALVGCAEALGTTKDAFVRQGAVQTMALGSIFDKLASDFGGFDDAKVDELGKQQGGDQAAMLNNEDCRPLARQSIKVGLLQQLDQNAIMAAFKTADVQLNPRYGRWNPTDTSIFGSSSISVPAGEATGS